MQDTGFARAILNEYAYEVVLWISRPAKLGEVLQLHCTIANSNTSELRFEEAGVLEPAQENVVGYSVGDLESEDPGAPTLEATENFEVAK